MKSNLFAIPFMLVMFIYSNAHGSLFTVRADSSSVRTGELPNTMPGVGLDTGIYLSVGQTLIVSADPNDLWNAGELPRWSNADGLIANRLATVGDESGKAAGTLIGTNFGLWPYSGLSAPYGALVGEVGGIFFLLGTNFSGPVPASGTLRLFFWDENNYDNTESIAVNVVAVPESGSLILFGLGLLAVAIIGRQARRR